jgi:hypothetical protein
MPTTRQIELYTRLDRMFGQTEPFRTILRGRQFTALSPRDAFRVIGELQTALQGWRFERLSRSVGLPFSDEDWDRLRQISRREEKHARRVVPDDVRQSWCADGRPPAIGGDLRYLDIQDELKESLEVDRGLFRPLRRVFEGPSLIVV